MFDLGDIVTIQGTDELPTNWSGRKATIVVAAYMQRKEFYKVLVWGAGETFIFHESQLTKESPNVPKA